jgi:hypothetical protein
MKKMFFGPFYPAWGPYHEQVTRKNMIPPVAVSRTREFAGKIQRLRSNSRTPGVQDNNNDSPRQLVNVHLEIEVI